MANNTENLIPFNKLTEEEQREIAKKGGEASVKARKERKTLREELKLMLELPGEQEKLCNALLKQAQRGNTKAFEVLRDTVGEKPTDNLNIGTDGSFNITVEYVEPGKNE